MTTDIETLHAKFITARDMYYDFQPSDESIATMAKERLLRFNFTNAKNAFEAALDKQMGVVNG